MRLIDANSIKFEEDCTFTGEELNEFIKSIPTSYDVDKVVEQIRKEVGDCEYECVKCKQTMDCDTCRAEKAAEIVKAGMKG